MGGWWQAGPGVTALAEAASWGPSASSGVRSRLAARTALPGRGYFRPGLGHTPRGPGSHQCAAFSLVQQAPVPAAGSPDPRSHFHGNSPRPWEMLPGLSFPPRKRGEREGEETSGSPLPNRGHRHDARAMGTAGGASGSANAPAAQLPAPVGLCCGVRLAPWGSLPFPGGAGTQPQRCCPPAGSLGRTAGHAGSCGVREERPTATSCCGPRLHGHPKLQPSLCRGAARRGLIVSPGTEEPLLRLPPPGSRLAPGSTGALYNKPIDWGHPGIVPSAPTSATRQLPPPWPRGHRGRRGFLALHHPHQPVLAPTGTGTHQGWCAASCTPAHLLRPQTLCEAAQFSADTRSTGLRKRAGGTQPCPLCQGMLCASVSLTVIDPQV